MNKNLGNQHNLSKNENGKNKLINKQLQRICNIAVALVNCGAKAEYEWYQKEILQELAKVFRTNKVIALLNVLNNLQEIDYEAAELVHNMLEVFIEHFRYQHEQTGMLFVIPIVISSFYQIPNINLTPQQLANLNKVLQDEIFCPNTQLVVDHHLYSAHQLPDDLPTLFKYRNLLSEQIGKEIFYLSKNDFEETSSNMTESQYLIGVAIINENQAPFRWNLDNNQATDQQMYQVLNQWRKKITPLFAESLKSCSYELLLPYAFHEGIRQSKLYYRRYSIENSILFIQHKLDIPIEDLSAVSAVFGNETEHQELRISFFADVKDDEADFALVLPSNYASQSEDLESLSEEITTILLNLGVKNIHKLNQIFELEYCEGCQAVLYPNLAGELVHARFSDEDFDLGEILH